jgi:hypothetical protein
MTMWADFSPGLGSRSEPATLNRMAVRVDLNSAVDMSSAALTETGSRDRLDWETPIPHRRWPNRRARAEPQGAYPAVCFKD